MSKKDKKREWFDGLPSFYDYIYGTSRKCPCGFVIYRVQEALDNAVNNLIDEHYPHRLAKVTTVEDLNNKPMSFGAYGSTMTGVQPSREENKVPLPTRAIGSEAELNKVTAEAYKKLMEDKNLALKIVFVEFPDELIVHKEVVAWVLIGENRDNKHLSQDLRSILTDSNRTSVIADDIAPKKTLQLFKDQLNRFAENGAFWGDEKPVPRIEENTDGLGGEYTMYEETHKGGWDLYQETIDAFSELAGVEIPIYKTRKFSCTWEEFPREFEMADFDEFDGRFNQTVEFDEMDALDISYQANKLNNLPVKIHTFEMRLEDE